MLKYLSVNKAKGTNPETEWTLQKTKTCNTEICNVVRVSLGDT